MKILKRILATRINNTHPQHGGMLVELLLSVAIAAVILPFVFQYQHRAVRRAENIAITREMSELQSALERYIVENRETPLNAVGKNITRVELSDLGEFGASPDIAADKYQLRVLKSADNRGRATLQGVVIMTDPDITPLRTREIVGLGGNQMGFVDGNRVYGAFNAWHTDAAELGIGSDGGIVAATAVNRDNALYLWRIPSDDVADATMLSALNLGNHDITGGAFLNSSVAQFGETLSLTETSARDAIFQNKTSVGGVFTTNTATVSGMLSSDSRVMNVGGNFNLADTGRFSSFTTGDLWVTNLTLGGLSVETDGGASVLKITSALDMTYGRIDAMYVSVGFTGSVTPRLVVYDRIEDSQNPAYYWDAKSGAVNFMDVSLAELARMSPLAVYYERSGGDTITNQLFRSVSANKNATASDYMNAITEIQNRVRAKYRLLNL